MFRLFAALFLILSFAFSPAMADCCEQFTTNASTELHHSVPDDSGKEDMAVHHCASCCHQHASNRQSVALAAITLRSVSIAIPAVTQDLVPSFNPGPLLEPPSHV